MIGKILGIAFIFSLIPMWRDTSTEKKMNLWEYVSFLSERRQHIPAKDAAEMSAIYYIRKNLYD